MAETILTIATATRTASVAITREEAVLGEVTLLPARSQSEVLLPNIDRLLTDVGLALEDVDAYGVVVGPGAFTGLRVGVATVKGLALGHDKPLLAVSSLQTLALQVPDLSMPVYALLDARKGEVYAGRFEWEQGSPRLQGAEQVVDPELLLSQIGGEALFVGDGALAYRNLIVRRLGARARFAPQPSHVLRSSFAAMIALQRLRGGEVLSAAELNPVYIRPSDAELNMVKTATDAGIEG